jgi:hypothetical protein
LFTSLDPPELALKDYKSVLLKSFRKNVLNNDRWPEAPVDGWVLPDTWFGQIKDIVRTTFVVKYLDGVANLTDELGEICERHSVPWSADYEAREEGYYASHFSLSVPVEIPQVTWDTDIIDLKVELQVTTQLQEVIRRLTHRQYEMRRLRIEEPTTKWQWDYKSDEFKPNYLGHILHYVEGMIMEIRDGRSDLDQEELA